MNEWEKGDWTFHGKGLWLYEDPEKEEVDMTVIGSSNFTYRGNRRDTEAQLYIVAECDHLKKRLHEEAERMYENSQPVDYKTVLDDGIDKITWKERVLNKLFSTFV